MKLPVFSTTGVFVVVGPGRKVIQMFTQKRGNIHMNNKNIPIDMKVN